MILPDPKALIDDLQASVTDPEKKLLVATLATDLTRIAAQALVDPVAAETELRYVRASTANLAAAEAAMVEQKVLGYLAALLRAAIVGS